MAVKKNKNKTNYIPDHGVVNASKSGTMQIVFGASVKCDNISFNDKLLPGVDYLNILVGVLTKFRHGKYVIIVNIEKLFSQMKIKEEYLDAPRFFWRHSDQDEVSYYVMLSYLSVCPYICNWSLKQSVKNQAKIIQPTVNKKISTDDKGSWKDYIKLITVFYSYEFWLTKFVSISTTVLMSLPLSEISPIIVFYEV